MDGYLILNAGIRFRSSFAVEMCVAHAKAVLRAQHLWLKIISAVIGLDGKVANKIGAKHRVGIRRTSPFV